MKKFFGTILTVAGAFAFGFFYLLTAYHIYFNSYTPVYYLIMYGALGVAGAVVAVVGRRLYKSNGEGRKARQFYGVLLCLIGTGLIGEGLFWAYVYSPWEMYRYGQEVELPAAAILAVLGGVVVFLGTRMCRKAKAYPSYPSGKTAKKSKPTPPPEPPKPAEPTAAVCPDCGRRYPVSQVYCEACGALLEKK